MVPSFVHYWQYGGGCLVTNSVPQVNRKSHGYLVGSPWQWRKQKFALLLLLSISSLRRGAFWLVTVWLGAHPKCSGAGLSSSGLIRSRGSGGDIFLQQRRWMKIQVCFLANLNIYSGWRRVWLLLFQVLQIRLFPSKMSSGPTFSLNGLAGPSPLKKKKSNPPPPQYNQTQYASAMLFIK